jgi:outer membrane protein assembly factor BamB
MKSVCGWLRVALFLAVLPALACSKGLPAAEESSGDWPQFRGKTGMGTSAAKGLPEKWSGTESIAWKVELPGAGTSCPVTFGDRIFVACYIGSGGEQDIKRYVICLDRDGNLLWKTEIETKLPEQARIREEHGYASSTPAVDSQRVYAFFGKSGVVVLDHDGRKLWQAEVGDKIHGWGTAASPVLFEDLVIVNASVESDSLVALHKKTGREAWRARGIRESWNTPVLVQTADGKTELIVAIMGKVLGFDPASGDELWSCATEIGWYMVPSLVAHEDVVYCIGGRTGGALAVRVGGRGDVTRTHRLWTGRKGSNVSSPIYHEGHLYWMHDNGGIAYCADAKTGEIIYEERLGRAGQVYASPLLADGKLYYVTRSGRTYVLAAKPKFEQLAVNDIAERGVFNAGLVESHGRLYLRSNKHLYCIARD